MWYYLLEVNLIWSRYPIWGLVADVISIDGSFEMFFLSNQFSHIALKVYPSAWTKSICHLLQSIQNNLKLTLKIFFRNA